MNKSSVLYPLIIAISVFLTSCNKLPDDTSNIKSLQSSNVHVSFAGERDGFKIWIVDGDKVRKNFIEEFLYGGNSERYTFIPRNEIWVDNSISSEEFETTVAHEIKEYKLMSNLGLLYADAHDSALNLEVSMRKNWEEISREHENRLDSVTPRDFDSTMEIVTLPEKIKLKNVYRIPLGEHNGINVWVVDGYVVRRDIFPDFGFSGNDREYFFIPKNEIWIDGQVSCGQTNFSIASELKERELMLNGKTYDIAYLAALDYVKKLREENDSLIAKQPDVKKTEPLIRDTGTASEK